MNEVPASCSVVLHIGAPKTGSSALQHFLFNNRDVLLRKGVFYPTHGFDVNNISGGHSGIGAALIDQDEDRAQKIFNEYKLHAAKQGKTLLLSAESFYNFPVKIKKLCLAEDDIKVLSFFRDPIESLVSGYNQSVKRHYYTGSLGDFCQSTLERGNRSVSGEILYDWVGAFSAENLVVSGYNKPVHADSALEKKFLTLLGLSESEFDDFSYTTKPINRAYNAVALEFKRCLNLILDKARKAENQAIDFLLQKVSDEHSARFEHIAPFLDVAAQKALAENFTDSTHRVFQDLLLSGTTVESILAFSPEPLIGVSELRQVALKIDESDSDVAQYIRECLADVDRSLVSQSNIDELDVLVNIYGSAES